MYVYLHGNILAMLPFRNPLIGLWIFCFVYIYVTDSHLQGALEKGVSEDCVRILNK